jgi:hypothetical protein
MIMAAEAVPETGAGEHEAALSSQHLHDAIKGAIVEVGITRHVQGLGAPTLPLAPRPPLCQTPPMRLLLLLAATPPALAQTTLPRLQDATVVAKNGTISITRLPIQPPKAPSIETSPSNCG